MSFEAVFYRVNSDPRQLNKFLGAVLTTQNVNFKDGRDKLHPVIELRYDPSNTTVYPQFDQVNYVRIDTGISATQYKYRYYFIDKVIAERTGLFRIECRMDVLMTWQYYIKDLNVTLDRSETIFNGYLPDGEYSALGYRAITCKAFSDALDDDSYVLMTTG